MKIDKNSVVSLTYELREGGQDGRMIQTVEEERPMTFIYGVGNLLPAFEANIWSLQKGDNFSFLLDPESAYGEKREDMIINLPHSIFENEGKLDENVCRVGNEVPMMDSNGNRINGTIVEISDTSIRMDFNHPMAGVALSFSGKIVEVREATDAEINSLNGSCSSCGSKDSSGCSGDCN
jgi:FKBP-type peptidyl-prolyl cis-trans isomerase SlyD